MRSFSAALALCLCLTGAVADQRHRSSRRFLPHRSHHPFLTGVLSRCSVNGISLFDGARWSPQPCSVCQCEDGEVTCRSIPCSLNASPSEKSVANNPSPAVSEQTHSRSGQTERGPPRDGTESPEVKPKKSKTLIASGKAQPANGLKKPVRKTPEDHGRWSPDLPTDVYGRKAPHLDSDDDDDYMEDDTDDEEEDEENSSISLYRSALRPVVIGRRMVPPARKPSTPALAPPTRRSVILPTGRPLPAPRARPVDRYTGFPAFQPSLPAGCLLADSLIACGNTGITQMPVIRDAGVRSLFLADNKISKIPAQALVGLPNLEWLDLSKNKLDDFSLRPDVFRNLTKLRRLNLDGNNLTKVPALPASLVELKINDNKLSGLTPHCFNGLSHLLTLDLEDNRFHDGNVSPLAFRPLKRLIYLRLDDNKFRALPSGLPVSLQELHLADNKIEVVHSGLLNKTTSLRVLNLSHNRIREDRIDPRAWIHLLKLEYLDLSHNKLVHVPSFLPVGLRRLTLHHNQIERIPGYVFGHLRPGLDLLHLSHNRLREDGMSEVSFLGLYHSLTELLLDHNQLRSVPRGILQLKALLNLRLDHNYISYITMNSLCDSSTREDSPLVSVHLEHNLIQRRLIPPAAFTCIRNYHSVLLRPQRYEETRAAGHTHI